MKWIKYLTPIGNLLFNIFKQRKKKTLQPIPDLKTRKTREENLQKAREKYRK